MTKQPNYSKGEKTVFIIALIVATISYIAYFNTTDEIITKTILIPLTLSFSEIIFIIIYRDVLYTSDEEDRYNHNTLIIAILKTFSIVCGLITSLMIGGIIVLVSEIIKKILSIISYISITILIFVSIIVVNRIMVQCLYKPPKK